MPKTIAIFGDSYVRRPEDYCKGDLGMPGEVHWLGRGGIRTDIKNQALYRRLLELRPDAAIIHLGGNDITITSTPRDIFSRLTGFKQSVYRAFTSGRFCLGVIFPEARTPILMEKYSKTNGRKSTSCLRKNTRLNVYALLT